MQRDRCAHDFKSVDPVHRVDGGNHDHGLVRVFIQPGPSNALLRKRPKYDSCLKRTIPYVSLATDSSGRNMCVDTIISNVYIGFLMITCAYKQSSVI